MIEKFDDQNGFCMADFMDKINELVDAVNGILDYAPLEMAMKAEPEPAENVQPDGESRPENVQDDYAKYRGWAGKLCRFWNEDKDRAIYDILEEVIANWYYQFRTKSDYVFDYCEPVKPDDDIIYKGE